MKLLAHKQRIKIFPEIVPLILKCIKKCIGKSDVITDSRE
jgi:hypothetical protein